MFRVARLSILLALLTLTPAVHSEDKAPAPELLALQEAVKKAIADADPSIACILVSRSENYRKLEEAPATDITPGRLGRFDETALKKLPMRERDRLVRTLDLSKPGHVPESYGSGVVIDDTGLVLTKAHVVRNASKIYVRFSGNRGSWADIHALDPRSDLAVLRLQDKIAGLKAVKFGNGDAVEKGQFVLLMANPFAAGFRDGSPSASWGLISNIRRRLPDPTFNDKERHKHTLHLYPILLQLDTRLNLGCSGGGVFNLKGQLIGLTTAKAALEGSETPGGFALPLDAGVKRIIEVLRRGEEVEYGFLGIGVVADREGKRVVISNVANGSPAQRAGLVAEQYLVSIAGAPVRNTEDVFLLIGTQLAGARIKVEVETPGGRRETHTAVLAKYFVDGQIIASKQPAPRRGLRVDYTSTLNGRPTVAPWIRDIPDGVLIREVVPGSPADKVKLQVDKIITRINNRRVTTPDEFYREMDKETGRVNLTLMNEQGGEETVTVAAK
jgi:S1-C subfamily serine protease